MTSAAHDTRPRSEPVWSVAAVARRLGVAPATLRSWSVRYGIGPIDHRAGRYRRYSSSDVAELDTLRRLRDQGVPLATAATLARERRLQSSPGPLGTVDDPNRDDRNRDDPNRDDPNRDDPNRDDPNRDDPNRDDPNWDDTVTDLENAARDLDAESAVRLLDTAFADNGIVTTWDRLCRPALARTSLATVSGSAEDGDADLGSDATAECVDAECVLTWAITTSLRRRPPSPPPPAARRVLLACATGEQHTLALDALFAALDEEQIPARMLGPSVPAPALLHAAAQTLPRAVFVWAQTNRTASPATLRGLGRHAGSVIAAGPGWRPETLPRRVLTAGSLDDAVVQARDAGTEL